MALSLLLTAHPVFSKTNTLQMASCLVSRMMLPSQGRSFVHLGMSGGEEGPVY